MKTISILGSTGSIGTQALDVARWRGYRVRGLAAGRNWTSLLEQVREFGPELVSCDDSVADELRRELPPGTRLASGKEGAKEVAGLVVDSVVAAIPGMAGLEPTAHALAVGRHVALANKEAMVVAGPLMKDLATRSGGTITPLDSEHSALYQCLLGEDPGAVDALVLTASGGPFRQGPADLSNVTPEEALAHPNWSMGPKVTVDSATLFNKGLEVLEAHFLFEVPLERIEVVIHPQSLIHGLVRYADGSIKAQIGPHDMRLPIQYGIEGPRRPPLPLEPLPLQGEWQLLPPDVNRFPCLPLAYRAGEIGGLAPTYLNAADEVAVAAFLEGRLPFPAIARVLAEVLENAPAEPLSWSVLEEADRAARRLAGEACRRLGREMTASDGAQSR
ncbi:MAG TPA: 1-deoxy-D-xylulose-5-phosphate reductoisomerase [Trueperaceae bacterium]